MSYCVNCGVELADYIKKCPLCNTEVQNPNKPYDPQSETDYPETMIKAKNKISPYSVLALLAMIFLLPTIVCLLIDINMDPLITWSGYVISALLLLYTLIAIALLSKGIPIIISELLAIFAITLFTAYINHMTGGDWFLAFGLPIIAAFGLCLISMTIADKLLRITVLGKIAFSFMLSGVFAILIEILISYNFYASIRLSWSMYPLAVLLICGTILLYIDKNIALKRKLTKRFFL